MPYFALFYEVVDNFVERRTPFRDGHLAHAREAQNRGELLLGGALSDPVDHAMIVFRAPDSSVARKFAESDPYVVNGLVQKWEVRTWNVVVGTAHEAGTAKQGA